MVDQKVQQGGHETRDVNARGLMWFAFGLVVVAVVLHLGLAGLYRLFKHKHPSPEAASRIELQPEMVAPQPRLQTNPVMGMEQFRAAEEAKLNGYAWIDRKSGIVRIPIDRAMDLLAERGLPARGPESHDASGKTPDQMRQEKAAAAVAGSER
jgi:hypothetical protein